MYKLFRSPSQKLLNAFGIDKFWRAEKPRDFWALKDINIEVKRGERLGIIGRNGAGKSTLLKIISKNVAPTEGSVIVNGRIQALMELGTGFHPEFTGRQNIYAALAYQGITGKKIPSLEEDIIDFSELEEFIDQPIKTYSAGMYARLAFSVATVIEPEILIIDEVLGAGDAYFAGKCVERMRKLTEASGATVLFVSHDLSSVQALCNRAIWLDRGILRMDGDPLDIIKQYTAVVRQDEEIRLLARDLKISKKQAVLLESMDEIYEKLLFHLIDIHGYSRPISSSKIRKITLCINDNEIGAIAVGAPTDNNLDEKCYIMDTPGYMNWGPSERDGKGFYRLFADFKGKYFHAPFEFAVPKGLLTGQNCGQIKIEGDFVQDTVALGFFDPQRNEYKRISVLSDKPLQTYELPELFSKNIGNDEKTELANSALLVKQCHPSEEYGSRAAMIKEVKLFNATNTETKTLISGQPFRIEITFTVDEPLKNPVFTFCAYALPLGITASQWVVETKEIGVDLVNTGGKLSIEAEKLLLGKGKYVATIGIYEHHPRSGGEPPAYHVLDRAVHFQIIGEDSLDMTDYGLCVHPIKSYLKTEPQSRK